MLLCGVKLDFSKMKQSHTDINEALNLLLSEAASMQALDSLLKSLSFIHWLTIKIGDPQSRLSQKFKSTMDSLSQIIFGHFWVIGSAGSQDLVENVIVALTCGHEGHTRLLEQVGLNVGRVDVTILRELHVHVLAEAR